MRPLYTVTPNPALDLSGHVDAIVPNEKNHVRRPRVDPGGNGINAARMAHRLGARTSVLGFIGGPGGRQIQALLAEEGVRTRFVPIEGDTRINVTVTNDADGLQTRLTFPGPRVGAADKSALLARVRSLRAPGILVLGGSLPEGCPLSYNGKIVRAAARAGLGVVIDVPARPLRTLLAGGPRLLLLKPNLAELADLAGSRLRSEREILVAARSLTSRAALACISLGPDGALLCGASRSWRGQAPHVKARGSVGAGDSMVGAMAARLAALGLCSPAAVDEASDDAIADVFRWGLAAGAATAAAEGTALGAAAHVARLVKRVVVERAGSRGGLSGRAQ